MSDPASQLRTAIEAWLRDDTDVIAAFGAKPVKVFKTLPPVNATAPYIFLAGFFVQDEQADCYDAAIVDVQVDVWSLTSPPGFAEAEAIAEAVKASLNRTDDGDSPAFILADHRVVAVEPVSTQYLTDPSDGKTVHAVIAARLSVDPID
jgi:hypothetical protein